MKRFNTAGPCVSAWHYMVPPSERLPEIRQLVLDNAYFVVHAPRQTGKTTTLMALCRELTEVGTHTALHFSCEAGEAAGDDYKAAEAAIIDAITEAAANALPEALRPPAPSAKRAIGGRLGAFLTAWAKQSPRPIALVFDEIDALRGMGRHVGEQLRAEKELSATSKITDPWDTPYQIRCAEDETYVLSYGPDKKEGTADDIKIPDAPVAPK